MTFILKALILLIYAKIVKIHFPVNNQVSK